MALTNYLFLESIFLPINMNKQERIRSILETQQELARHQVFDDLDPWLELEMSTAQLKALFVISSVEEGVKMRTFAERIGASTPYATGIVDRLIKLGLVERLPEPNDRRVVIVHLTDEGRSFLERLLSSMRSVAIPLFERMAEEDLAALDRGLRALLNVIQVSHTPGASTEAPVEAS